MKSILSDIVSADRMLHASLNLVQLELPDSAYKILSPLGRLTQITMVMTLSNG